MVIFNLLILQLHPTEWGGKDHDMTKTEHKSVTKEFVTILKLK